MAEKPLVLVILGPTATGKTKLSIELAKRFSGEIVSADSMQIYRHMDIGTAKPTMAERQGIEHYMMDIVEPSQQYSVSDYVTGAKRCIDQILSKGKLPVVVGGTGLYISSLVDNVRFEEMRRDENYRKELKLKALAEGGAALKQMLYDVDPQTAARLHENDINRLIRALEVYKATGKPISEWAAKSKQAESPYRFCMIGLRYADRKLLYQRINLRVDEMMEKGLVDEVKNLLASGVPMNATAMQAIGYKELVAYLDGKISFDEAVNSIKTESRRLAKRQMTWFRRDERINWIDVDRCGSFDVVLNKSIDILENYVNICYDENKKS